MKKFFGALALLGLLIPTLSFAGEGHTQSYNKDHPIPQEDFVLEYKLKDEKVEFEWSTSESEYFKYYKLTHSEDNSLPIYPKHTNKGYSADKNNTEMKVKARDGFWRLCVVYRGFYDNGNDGRYVKCSNVVELRDVQSVYKEHKKEEHKVNKNDRRKAALSKKLDKFYAKVEGRTASSEDVIAVYKKIQTKIVAKKSKTGNNELRDLLWHLHQELADRISHLEGEDIDAQIDELLEF